jgi:hypothetical protein
LVVVVVFVLLLLLLLLLVVLLMLLFLLLLLSSWSWSFVVAAYGGRQVVSGYMEDSMGSSSALTTPEDQVENLIKEVADEHNLDFQSDVPNAPRHAVKSAPALPQAGGTTAVAEEDDLAARLEALKK